MEGTSFAEISLADLITSWYARPSLPGSVDVGPTSENNKAFLSTDVLIVLFLQILPLTEEPIASSMGFTVVASLSPSSSEDSASLGPILLDIATSVLRPCPHSQRASAFSAVPSFAFGKEPSQVHLVHAAHFSMLAKGQ